MIKKPEIEGYVFLCSDATEGECLDRMLFGGQEKYVNRVKGIDINKKVFLYNYQSKKLHGVFEASSQMRENIVPKAWKGIYPWQIRVRRTGDYKPIARDDIPKGVLKWDMMGRPPSRLTAETVRALENIFKGKKRVRTYDDATQHVADDGHKVRSKPELVIDNWLYKNRIVHGYEAPIPDAKRCDFEIPRLEGNIYIEYWGLEDVDYLKNKNDKEKIYKKNRIRLIGLYQKDLKNLDKVLGRQLRDLT